MKLLSKIKPIFIFAIAFFLMERFCRFQTDGFSIAKIVPHHPLKSEMITLTPEIYKALDQPYYFLGSGVQCYAFVSEDQKTVLKFFKHYHLFPGNQLLKLLPFPYKQKILKIREERLHKTFKSCQIAFSHLKEETATLLTHFTYSECPKIKIFDKLGTPHLLDLSGMEFVLQKKGEPVSMRLQNFFQAQDLCGMEQLKKHHLTCLQKGFKTKDTKIGNYALIGGEPITIDIGSLKRIKNNFPWDIERRQKKFEQKLQRWREEFESNR